MSSSIPSKRQQDILQRMITLRPGDIIQLTPEEFAFYELHKHLIGQRSSGVNPADGGSAGASPSRVGDWLQTYTGKQFWPFDARVEDVDIRDIAHALSCQGRFAGHARTFYSVAQHSLLVSWYCHPADARWGLLHDASEAYLVDLPRPVKRDDLLLGYRMAERELQEVILRAFGLPEEEPESVRIVDERMAVTELRVFFGPPVAPLAWRADPYDIDILALSPAQAEMAFLQRFEQLGGTIDGRA